MMYGTFKDEGSSISYWLTFFSILNIEFFYADTNKKFTNNPCAQRSAEI